MVKYFSFIVSAFMLLLCGEASAQIRKVDAAIGDSVTLTTDKVSDTYAWSLSTDGKAFFTLSGENSNTLKVWAFSENYYRVRYKGERGYEYDTLQIVLPATEYKLKDYDVTAGHGFVETNGIGGGNISIPFQSAESQGSHKLGVTQKLTNWNDKKAHAVYFFNTPEGVVNLKMNVTANRDAIMRFRLRVIDTDTPDSLIAENIISFKGTGSAQVIPVIKFNLGKKGYHRYDLECLWGNTSLISINKWQFDLEENAEPYLSGRMMSPSVHIFGWSSTNPRAPQGEAYDWAYEEVKIPAGESGKGINATYVMSLGILDGYMGIQVGNDGAGRTTLFSMWDSGDTDVDPNLPDHLRSTAVDVGEGVGYGRFGNEGTGVQSYKSGGAFWDFDKYVQFISHCRNEISTYEVVENGEVVEKQIRNMLVSAWFNAQDEQGWQYIATLRLANRSSYISSWYSFVEDFVDYNGQEVRVGYFRNGYAKHRTGTKKWYHMNKIVFSNNDGGTHMGARNDYWQDVDPEDKFAWKMTTGGFANNAHRGKEQVPLRSNNTPVDTINLNALLAREELAFENERKKLDSIAEIKKTMLDKTGWELIKYSTEELTGEGSVNGRAANIIDGNDNTYWHSKWHYGVEDDLPHSFVIDMKQEIDINGFALSLSGGKERWPEEILIEGSNDNKEWNDVYENKQCPVHPDNRGVGGYVLKMDSTVSCRYLRLTIKKVYTGVKYGRMNEFSPVYIDPVTSIGGVEDDTKELVVYTKGNTICFDAPEEMESVKIDIFSMSGKQVVSREVSDIKLNDVVSIHAFDLVQGVYSVRVTSSDGKAYVGKVAVK